MERRSRRVGEIPINPATGRRAKTNNTDTTGAFADALDYHTDESTNTDGLGFVLTDSPFAGVDLDGLYDPESGEFDDYGREILDRLDSVTEFSPGGRGTHTYMIGDLPPDGRKKDPVEMYDSGRYFTVTGQQVPGTPKNVRPRDDGQQALVAVHRDHFGSGDDDGDDESAESGQETLDTSADGSVNPTAGESSTTSYGASTELDDDEIRERAMNAENGEKFRDLWNGSDCYHGGDTSEADKAMCQMLAFWTGGDADQMDQLFRASDRLRGKWDETHSAAGDTYGEMTIAAALDDQTEFYDPTGGSSGDGGDDYDAAELPDPSDHGFNRHNGGYGYWQDRGEDEPAEWVEWTNFQLEVTSFLVMEDGREEIALTVHPRNGDPYDVTAEPTTFNEKREFKKNVAKGRTTTFTGGGHALAQIKRFVGTQAAPDRRGVRHMGLHGDEFVTPNGTLIADGWTDEPEHVHVPREIEAERRFSITPDDGDDYDADAVQNVLTLLPQTRDPERFIPVLGWFYAAAVRPLIYEWTGEFNHLSVTGETEAGKTSTLSLMWELFGMQGDPLTADDTKFTVQATLGSSNAVPMWFDEYKPSDMAQHRIDTFHNELRKTTRGGTSQRGRPDGSTYAFHLHAPTVISGEERVQGPAEERRGIFSTFRSATTAEGSPNAVAFAQLAGGSAKIDGEVRHFDGLDLTDHALAYYRWVLDQNTDDLRTLWRETVTHVNELLKRENVGTLANLVEQGLRTIKFGCTLYRAFADAMGVDMSTIDAAGVSSDEIDNAIIYVATRSTGGRNRQSHLDTLLAIAGRAAHAGYIEDGEHYTLTYEEQEREELRINLTRAYDPIAKYVREYDVSEDVLGSAGDYRERVKDGEGHVPYIREVSQPTNPIGRCIGIHTGTAEDVISDFERALFTGEPDTTDTGDDATANTTNQLTENATAIRDLSHGGNPYYTITATVLSADQSGPDHGPAITGVIEDATGVIDYITWDDSPAVQRLADAEGEHVVIDRARLSTDREGDDVLEIEHATVEPISEGVAYVPLADPGANATLADGSGDGDLSFDGDSPVPEDAEGITADARRIAYVAEFINEHTEQLPIAKGELAARAADGYDMTPDRAMSAIAKAVERGLLIDDGNDKANAA